MPDDITVGRQVQAVRLARNLTQSEVAARAGVSKTTISRLECGMVSGMTISTVRSISSALRMPPLALMGWRGPEVERLLDRVHAAIVESVARRLESLGWTVWPEFSFSEFGERGSIDILAWLAAPRALLVVEAKSRLWDLQAAMMALDRKTRLAPTIAARKTGVRPRWLGVVLVMPESRTHRGVIQRHESTFRAALPDRQMAVKHWLGEPASALRGIWFLHIGQGAVATQRVRRKRARHGVPRAGKMPGSAGVRHKSTRRAANQSPTDARPYQRVPDGEEGLA